MAKEYRTRNRILLDLLKAVKDHPPGTVTLLLHATNLSTDRLLGYLDELVERNLLAAGQDPARRTYTLTEGGQTFLTELDRVDRFMANFGMRL